MMDIFNPLVLANCLLVLSAAVCGFLSYYNIRSRVNKIWFLLMLILSLWGAAYVINVIYLTNITVQLIYISAILIPVVYFHFIQLFLFNNKQTTLFAGYLIAVLLVVALLCTDLIAVGYRQSVEFGGLHIIPGRLYVIFLIHFYFYALYGIGLLWKALHGSDGMRRRQVIFVMISALIGFVAGTTDFLFDLFNFYPVGHLFVFLVPALIMYGIFFDKK